jgi:hypothetical protein
VQNEKKKKIAKKEKIRKIYATLCSSFALSLSVMMIKCAEENCDLIIMTSANCDLIPVMIIIIIRIMEEEEEEKKIKGISINGHPFSAVC